jgi:hypothetical protein
MKMAIRRNDREAYKTELLEVRQTTYFGYAKKVLTLSTERGLNIKINDVYNVVSGQKKDRRILAVIKDALKSEPCEI